MTDACVAAISDWVRVESYSRDAAGVNAMMDLVTQDVAGTSVKIERVPGKNGLGDMLILRAGPDNGRPHVMVMSHLDTVYPRGTLGTTHMLRQEGDRLYGPGVFDMKASAWLGLQAFKQVVAAGELTRPVVYIFTSDEEIGSPTSRALIEGLAHGAHAALVTEPARPDGSIVTARKGGGSFQMRITGRAAHAGTRHADGRSAIVEAAYQTIALEKMTDYAVGTTINVGSIKGGTGTNVIPQDAILNFEGRVTDPERAHALLETFLQMKPITPDVSIEVTGGLSRLPYIKTEGIQKLLDFARDLASEIGIELKDCEMVGGGSDANFTAALGIPTLDGLGVEGDGAHALHEHALISSFAPRRELMRRLLQRL